MIIINYAVGRRSFSQSRSTETTKLYCCFPADDDQFSKLKAVFLATGRGCRLDLPLVEVDNRLFVQLLLLKDEGSKTLDETAFFQQLLKPDLVNSAAFSSAVFMVNRLKELFGDEPLPELPPLHGHGGCQQRCQQVQEESDPGDVD